MKASARSLFARRRFFLCAKDPRCTLENVSGRHSSPTILIDPRDAFKRYHGSWCVDLRHVAIIGRLVR